MLLNKKRLEVVNKLEHCSCQGMITQPDNSCIVGMVVKVVRSTNICFTVGDKCYILHVGIIVHQSITQFLFCFVIRVRPVARYFKHCLKQVL